MAFYFIVTQALNLRKTSRTEIHQKHGTHIFVYERDFTVTHNVILEEVHWKTQARMLLFEFARLLLINTIQRKSIKRVLGQL